MKVVITYGTFDLFHVGHVRLLKRLSKLGDKLVVGISSDSFNEKKGKSSFFSYEERAEIVKACKYVDDVFPEYDWEQKIDDIKKHKVSIFAMGDDWTGKFDFLREYCDVLYLSRTNDISTTDIKQKLEKISEEDMKVIEETLLKTISLIKGI